MCEFSRFVGFLAVFGGLIALFLVVWAAYRALGAFYSWLIDDLATRVYRTPVWVYGPVTNYRGDSVEQRLQSLHRICDSLVEELNRLREKGKK